jgi:hypothetical protein
LLLSSAFIADVVMKVNSLLGMDEVNQVEKVILNQAINPSFSLSTNADSQATISILAILNPLSTAAQRFTPILEVFPPSSSSSSFFCF